jgi:hypothetical protein
MRPVFQGAKWKKGKRHYFSVTDSAVQLEQVEMFNIECEVSKIQNMENFFYFYWENIVGHTHRLVGPLIIAGRLLPYEHICCFGF